MKVHKFHLADTVLQYRFTQIPVPLTWYTFPSGFLSGNIYFGKDTLRTYFTTEDKVENANLTLLFTLIVFLVLLGVFSFSQEDNRFMFWYHRLLQFLR